MRTFRCTAVNSYLDGETVRHNVTLLEQESASPAVLRVAVAAPTCPYQVGEYYAGELAPVAKQQG